MATRQTVDTGEPSGAPARGPHEGRELESIGPSDSSDSGSDLFRPGTTENDSNDDGTSDRSGTGEGLTADGDSAAQEAADIAPDRIIGAGEAGLGGGLDQAEEAQLGVTDEELARRRRN